MQTQSGTKRPRKQRKGVVKRVDNRVSYKQVFTELDATLQQAARQHHQELVLHSLVAAHEQVLLDSILQHEEVALIKQAMQQALVPAPPPVGANQQHLVQPQPCVALRMVQQAAAGSGHYVTRLLCRVSPAVVADVLSWNSDQWHDFFEKAAVDLSLLLQVACRGAHPGEEQQQEQQERQQQAPPPYVHVAEQKLQQAVDRIATIGCIGSVYSEHTGQALGHCTSLNHITMQQEAAPQQHWAGVLQQMQLSQPQLVQLAGGFREFVRLRKVHQAAQLAVAEQASCSNSCSLQLLAASKHSSPATTAAGAAAAGSSAGAAAVPTQATAAAAAPRTRGERTPSSSCGTTPATTAVTGGSSGDGDDDAAGGGSAAAQEAAAAGGGGDDVDTPAELQRLLFSIHQSFAMLHSLMVNTLTHKQTARMLVASFPYVPLPAPLMEQAYEAVMKQAAAPPPRPAAAAACDDDDDTPSGEAAAPAAAPGPGSSAGAAAGDAPQPPAACAHCSAAGRVPSDCSDETQQFVQQRVALLVGQVQQWWLAERHLQEVAGGGARAGGGLAAMRQ